MSSDQSDGLCLRRQGSRTCDHKAAATHDKGEKGRSCRHQQESRGFQPPATAVPGRAGTSFGAWERPPRSWPTAQCQACLCPAPPQLHLPPPPSLAVSLPAPYLFPSEGFIKTYVNLFNLFSFFLHLLASPSYKRPHWGETEVCVLCSPTVFPMPLSPLQGDHMAQYN